MEGKSRKGISSSFKVDFLKAAHQFYHSSLAKLSSLDYNQLQGRMENVLTSSWTAVCSLTTRVVITKEVRKTRYWDAASHLYNSTLTSSSKKLLQL